MRELYSVCGYLTQQWSAVSLAVAGLTEGSEPLQAVGFLGGEISAPAPTVIEGEQTLAGGQSRLLLAGLLV